MKLSRHFFPSNPPLPAPPLTVPTPLCRRGGSWLEIFTLRASMHLSVLQCVAVCCSVLQHFSVCCSVLLGHDSIFSHWGRARICSVMQRVVVHCSVLQCISVFCSVLPVCVAVHVAVCVAAEQYYSRLSHWGRVCMWMCCGVLQCVAVCCSVLQCNAEFWCGSASWRWAGLLTWSADVPQIQCVAVCCSVLQCVAVCCGVLQCVAVCCSVLQCVAVCCSVLQCAAVCYRTDSLFLWYHTCATTYVSHKGTISMLLEIIGLFCKRAL